MYGGNALGTNTVTVNASSFDIDGITPGGYINNMPD